MTNIRFSELRAKLEKYNPSHQARVTNGEVLALLDYIATDAAEAKVETALAVLDRWDTPELRVERQRAGTFGFQRLIDDIRKKLTGDKS